MSREPGRVYRLSGLGRPLDPSYATNRVVLWAFAALLVAGTVWSSVTGRGWAEAVLAGVGLALLGFVAWALTRELDPDGERAAFVALGAAVVAWLLWPPQSILVPAALLLAARLVNRTTGKATEPVDSVVVVVGFAAAGWLVSWTLALLGAAALILDATLPHPRGQRARSYHLVAAAILAAATTPQWISGLSSLQTPSNVLVVLAAAGLAGVAVVTAPSPRSVGDVDGEPLEPRRIWAGTVLAIVALTVATFDVDLPTSELATAWACAAVAALAALRRRLARSGA